MAASWLARWLLSRALPRDRAEFVLGDLEEMHARRVRGGGRLRAHAWYWYATASVLLRRERWAPSWGGLALDVRASVRSLRRTPGFTFVACGTLALGLGATVAVFALADRLLLRMPPGVHRPGGAVYVDFAHDNGVGYLSPRDVDDLRDGAATVLEQATAVSATRAYVAVGSAEAVSAQVAFVDGPLFDLLGVRALRGRLPSASDLAHTAPADIAVIGERLWATQFARDPDAVGATLRLNGHVVTVVAIAADGFAGLERDAPVDVWLPSSALVPVIDFERDRLMSRRASLYPHLIARLQTGLTAEAAAAALRAVADRITASLPEGESTLQGVTPRVHEGIAVPPEARAATRRSLRVLGGVVVLVLAVACANLANLLVFRALRERRQLAVRRALGASRMRIVAQQLIGHALITAGSLVAGLLFAWGITRLFAGHSLSGVPALNALELDGRLLLFACVAAVGSGLLAGVLPAWLAARTGPSPTTRMDGVRSTGRHAHLRHAMTVVQLTASLALIAAALQLTRTVRALYAIDPGYATANVQVVPLDFPTPGDLDARLAALARAEEAAAAVPGVERAALDIAGPLVPRLRGPVVRPSASADRVYGIVTFVTPAWFDLMDVRVVSGRPIDEEDLGPAGLGRAMISEGLARTLFGDENAVGRTIHAFGRRGEVEVIGVVEDIRYATLLGEPEPVVYHVWTQPLILGTTVLLFRTTPGSPAATADAVRDAILRAVPGIGADAPVPLEDRVDAQLADHRLRARLLVLLSLLAAVLAGIGLYGVVAYAVADRTREFGIRMALGARSSGIAGLVLRQTGVTVFAGVVLGLAGATLLARGIASRLDGVATLGPGLLLGAITALVAIAVLASIAPVRSATRMDPLRVLREE